VIEGTRKKPLDWRYSYSCNDKIPFGSFLLKDVLKSIYPNKKITENNSGLYLYSDYNPVPEKSEFIFITKFFTLDKLDLDKMLSFAAKGNDIFISAEEFSGNITDTLKFKTGYNWKQPMDSNKYAEIYFTNPALAGDSGYSVNTNFTEFSFTSCDTVSTTVIGMDKNRNPNFIRIPLGDGNIFVNSTPLLFTNYNILYGNYRYPFTALSYLHGNAIVWDEHYKPNKPDVKSPLRFILRQPALKAAYYLLLIAIILYVIFKGKRKQRIIPVVMPPKNMSLEFANTLGQLYFNSGNNRDIALKKYSYFCDYLRSKFYIKNISEDTDLYQNLSERAGVPVETISYIIINARIINNQAWIRDIDLIDFNSKIEEFYNKTK
jgi:hypothetical protein